MSEAIRVNETVVLRSVIKCGTCKRTIDGAATRDGECTRTGNTTEAARYVMQAVTNDVEFRAKNMRWEFDREFGWKCIHCVAHDVDKDGGEERAKRMKEAEERYL